MSKYFSKALVPGTIEPFMHKGERAIHQVLPSLLTAIGQADVRVCTFNVSEDALRPLFFLTESGQIRELSLLVDTTVKRHKLGLYLFAANITSRIRIDNCHAKLLLVENDRYRFGIAGSANLNLNHRWENGFYFSDGMHYDYFKTAYDKAYDSALPYEPEY